MDKTTSTTPDQGNKLLGLRIAELVIEYSVSISTLTLLLDTNNTCVNHGTFWLNRKCRLEKRLKTLTSPNLFTQS